MAPAEDISLSVRGVRKSYPRGPETVEVIRDASFGMRAGESLAITGPSGSGKSTLLHLIGTLDRPTAGAIELNGRRPHELPEPALAAFRNHTIGFVFQDHHLLPQYSLLENTLIPSLASGRRDGTAAGRARSLLETVGLGHRLHHRPDEVSGGERQRAAVARALVNGPRLILCDEPTGNLDSAAATAVADLLIDLHLKDRALLIVVTHSLELAGRCQRQLRLVEGACFEP